MIGGDFAELLAAAQEGNEPAFSVARMLARTLGAVRVAAHRGLRRLAEILAEAGVTL